jgi:hypothetical protein
MIIVFKNEDGSCGIVHPTKEGLEQLGIEGIIKKDVPPGKSYRILDKDKLPSDRYFRNAWTDHNPTETVDVDINKAKEIKKNHFRISRAPLLAQLDVEYQRADEEGNHVKKQEIAAKKQSLRDVTKVELPNDLDQLKRFIPSVLTDKA